MTDAEQRGWRIVFTTEALLDTTLLRWVRPSRELTSSLRYRIAERSGSEIILERNPE